MREPPAGEQAAAAHQDAATAAPVPPDPRIGALFLGGGRPAYVHRRSARLGGRRPDPHRRALRGRRHRHHFRRRGFKDAAAPDDVWRIDAIYLDPRWVTEPGPAGRLRDRAGQPRRGRVGGGPGRRRPDAGAGPETGHRRHRHRLRDGRRRRPDRLSDRHGGSGKGLSVAGLRGTGRRPFGRAVDRRVDRHGRHRRAERRRAAKTKASRTHRLSTMPSRRLLARAEAGGPPDIAPTVFDDDCD